MLNFCRSSKRHSSGGRVTGNASLLSTEQEVPFHHPQYELALWLFTVTTENHHPKQVKHCISSIFIYDIFLYIYIYDIFLYMFMGCSPSLSEITGGQPILLDSGPSRFSSPVDQEPCSIPIIYMLCIKFTSYLLICCHLIAGLLMVYCKKEHQTYHPQKKWSCGHDDFHQLGFPPDDL